MALLRELIQPAQLERCGDRSFPVLSMTMHDGIMLQSDRFKKSLASVDQSAYKVVRRNQLVVGFPIDEGVLYIQQVVDAGIMSPAYDVWNVDETKVDLRYFELCLHSPQSMMFYKTNLRGTTARRRSLPKDTLLSLPVPVPSMERQCEIASTLDRLQALIRLRQHQLCALDQLIKARFVEMFGELKTNEHGYPVMQLGDLVTDIIAGWSANGESRIKKENEKAVLKVSAVTQGFFKPDEHKALADDLEIKKYVYPHKGDMLFSRANTRELVGATAIIEQDYPDLLLPDKLWRVLFSDTINVYYAKYALSMDSVRQEFSAQSTGTSGSMFNVSAEKFKSIRIPVSPIELQKQFAAFVSQVDKSKVVDLSVFTNRAKSYII